jgi:hypothetical protein
MEVEVELAAVVATYRAAAATFGDEERAHSPMSARDRFADASFAPIHEPLAAAIAVERDEPMPGAFAKDRGAVRVRRSSRSRKNRFVVHEHMFACYPDGRLPFGCGEMRPLGIEPRPPV